MTKKIYLPVSGLLAVAVALICAVAFSLLTSSQPALGSSIDTPIYTFNGNSTSTLISTASAPLVGTSTSRRFLLIQNAGSTTAYCNTDGKPGIDQQGFFMAASSSRTFEGSSLYTGAINCIASSSVRMLAIEAI